MNPKLLCTTFAICLALGLAACAPPAAPAAATPTVEAPPPTAPPAPTATSPAPQSTATPAPVAATGESEAAKIDALLAQPLQGTDFMGAVLVAKDGSVLFSKGYGMADVDKKIPNTPQTRFRIGDLTKQFTAVAILMLQEQGKLNVKDSVCKYVPDCPEKWQGITIENLLTHTAGLYDFADFSYKGKTNVTPSSSAQVIARVKERSPKFAPGTTVSFSNGNYDVAGYIVEQVSGQSYEQFLQDHIFTPLGMKNTGYAHDDSGLAVGYAFPPVVAPKIDGSLPYASNGLYSSTEDLYRYTQALNSGSLISPESLAALLGQHRRVDGLLGPSETYRAPIYFGYGWKVADYSGHRMAGHDGMMDGYGSDLRIFPDDKAVVIVLMNRTIGFPEAAGDPIVKALFETK